MDPVPLVDLTMETHGVGGSKEGILDPPSIVLDAHQLEEEEANKERRTEDPLICR